MKHCDLIQVLWVEDDNSIINQLKKNAFFSGLELVAYPCWDDAKEALESDYDRWSAIILDAKCKHHRDSADSAVVFLREALKDISVLAEKKDRVIPWYVLTGGDTSEVSDSINDEREKWDKDWTDSTNKKYYSKNTDTELLYNRIRYHANISPLLQIHKMYHNVFDAIEECGIGDEAYNNIEDLLVPIHFPEKIENKDFNDKFKKARIILENIFRNMSTYGILPDWGKNINVRWSSCILSGKPAMKYITDGEDIVVIEAKESVLPVALNDVVRLMVNILPADVHAKSSDANSVNLPDYINSVDGSTYLLKSIALQLCDLILWYRNYLRDHKDKEQNALKYEIKEPKYLNLRK
jgi:hypothetical protein